MPLATAPSDGEIAAVARWTLPQCGGQRDDRRSLAISRQKLIAGLIHGWIGRWPIEIRAQQVHNGISRAFRARAVGGEDRRSRKSPK